MSKKKDAKMLNNKGEHKKPWGNLSKIAKLIKFL